MLTVSVVTASADSNVTILATGEGIYTDANGWQDYKPASTVFFMPMGGIVTTFGIIHLVQYFKTPEVLREPSKLIAGIIIIALGGISLGYGVYDNVN